MNDIIINIGPYIIPFPILLSTLMAVFFSLFNNKDGTNLLPDRVKNGIALFFGIGFGLFVMIQKHPDPTWDDFVGWGVFGLLEGASAVGLYKSARIWSGKS